MYKKILLTLDGRESDRPMVEHVKSLAKLTRGRVILHWVEGLTTGTSGDIEHLRQIYREFLCLGIHVELELSCGDPVTEIIKRVQHDNCDLVTLAAHKRHFFRDFFLGSTANCVQNKIKLPILLFRAGERELNSSLP